MGPFYNINELSRFAQLYKKTYIPYSQMETITYIEILDVTNITYTDLWGPYINC
jgi:hypothetical protein